MSGRGWSCPKCQAPFRTDFLRCPVDGALLEDVAGDPLIGPLHAGRYRLLRVLGEGGAGRVYQAEHAGTGRPLAVKVLFGEVAAGERSRKRFRREATAASRLDHPGIVEVIDFVEEGALLLIVLGLVDGPDLGRVVLERGMLDWAEALDIVEAAADALAHAHERGVIHRDLKPENILLEASGAIRIVDFGLALERDLGDERLTEHGALIGTPAFVSPEQLVGQGVDERTDLYALGAVLFFLLAGRPPFEGSALDIVQRVLAAEAPRVDALAPATPRGVVDLTDRLLAKRRQDRPRSAVALLELVGQIRRRPEAPLPLEPSPAPPATVPESSAAPGDRPAPAASDLDPEEEGLAGGAWASGRALAVLAALLALGGGAVALRSTGSADAPAPTSSVDRAPRAALPDLGAATARDSGARVASGAPEEDASAAPVRAERTAPEVRSRPPAPPRRARRPRTGRSPGGRGSKTSKEPRVEREPGLEGESAAPTTDALVARHRAVGVAIAELAASAPERAERLRARYLALPLQRALRDEDARREMMRSLRALAREAR